MFTKDSRTENFLTSIGVEWKYRSGLKVQDLADDWHTENIGRPVPVRDDAVLEYATLMESGSSAPAPILLDGVMSVLDGVQRICAAEMAESSLLSAYVVKTDSEDLVAMIRVMANARLQGRAEPAEWTRRQAVSVLVVERGMSTKEVSLLGGWKAPDIERLAECIRLQSRIEQAGGPSLPDRMLGVLHPHLSEGAPLEKAREPVTGMLHTLKAAQLSACDAKPFVDDFFEAVPARGNHHNIFGERLEALRDDPEIESRLTGRKASPLRRDVVLLRSLRAACTTLSEITQHGDEVTNVDEFLRLLSDMREKLIDMSPHLKQKERVGTPADLWSRT